MSPEERIERAARFLAEEFANGTSSISRDDELADGVNIHRELSAIRNFPEMQGPDRELLFLAFDTMVGVWSSGYELASRDDFASDDSTVGTIICDYVDELDEAPTPG